MKQSTKKGLKYVGLVLLSGLLLLIGLLICMASWIAGGIVMLAGAVLFIIFSVKAIKISLQDRKKTERKPKEKIKKEIKSVRILGTRTGMETRVLGTYNFTVYSMMIFYKDGSRDVVDVDGTSPLFKSLVPYIKANEKPITVDEMIEFDEMDE